MKAIISTSIDTKVAEWLNDMATELKQSRSELTERYIKEGLSRDSYVSLICPKCGASYSSKLSECPGCKV